MSESINVEDPPVTIVAVHKVKPGKEKAFEQTMSGLLQAAMSFEGHLGANILRPDDSDDPQYSIIFKFNRMSNLRRWEESEERQEWLVRLARLTQDSSPLQILTGLETWFTLPLKRAIVPPPRYKMALITWLAIFPLISGINALFGSFLNQLPPLFRSLVLTAVLVPLMTYVVMPRITRLFAPWLYPSTPRPPRKASRLNRKQRHRTKL
ncbi:antibiotic biosynthesis monooxygenase [Chroococcidiopsis sp. CCMEE 29]|jgi:antibiotic biosynthesis monooxygenase (ABM) superfamily enzyme|uniref:antibiotic biosynthesis monooxygenase n=1 Tax=Chroococcidiopsis sp. CCMEE 29 TaxID=155894 RepID=UPI00202257F0|nr:antibiotic biosynthesis monooxygenase [Chroococcidiopsis sp. CCMEE 29]